MKKLLILALLTLSTWGHAEENSPQLTACFAENKSSGWHIIANENDCYLQEYQRQIDKLHQQISVTYQQLLALSIHKDKQASGSLTKMYQAWQQYRDNKCQMFQALELPFRHLQQSNCEVETTKNYVLEQQQFLQELQQTLADDKSLK